MKYLRAYSVSQAESGAGLFTAYDVLHEASCRYFRCLLALYSVGATGSRASLVITKCTGYS